MKPISRPAVVLLFLLVAISVGCAGHASVELAAADALEAVASQTALALDEYRADLDADDTQREHDLTLAFVARTRADHSDDERMSAHVAAFAEALARIRADRRATELRYQRAVDNLGVLRETAAGLRRLALDSLRLEDEAHRYLGSMLEARRRASATASTPTTGENAKSVTPLEDPS
ncbi:MAG: hypothetical protein L6Q92_14920 [Phycisphaerae bacterium]|nr:hypothetical protein [Phycisphaerae bacterium]